MNKVMLIGRLSNEPEYRKTQNGISHCTFRVAVQRQFANSEGKRESDFFTCVAWRQSADFVNNYIRKGGRVAVEGSLQNRSYDAQDGTKRYVTEVVCDRVESLESRKDNAEQTQTNNGFTEIDDADLPF